MKKIKEYAEFVAIAAIMFVGMYAVCLAGYLFD